MVDMLYLRLYFEEPIHISKYLRIYPYQSFVQYIGKHVGDLVHFYLQFFSFHSLQKWIFFTLEVHFI